MMKSVHLIFFAKALATIFRLYMLYISSAKRIIYQCKTNHLPLDFKSFTTGLLKFFQWTLKVLPLDFKSFPSGL